VTTQLPTWHGEPVPPPGPMASAGSRHADVPTSGPRPDPGGPAAPVGAGPRGAAGTVIAGRYALRAAIGHGGMGTVWRASDTLLRRDVAVKEVLLPQGLADSDRDAMYQRTLREARAAAALQHPSVVQVYDVVTDGGRPWIVMELLQARSLAEMIVEDGPLAARAVAKIGIALLGALEVAHAGGVLHRDVKPANVLICADGRCVLTDFGVARMPTDSQLTTPGMVLGSPHFISPERAIGASFGPPSDLFSLGVTLYTAVEGRPPFDRPDPFETMRAVVEEPPAPALRAGALAGVLYGLLEKDPARRWDVQTARVVLRDLLSGALASNAPAHVTDPYAVVRPAPYTPPPAVTATGQIGGRAMIAPGETVSGAIRRLKGGAEAPGQHRPGEGDHAGAGYGQQTGFQPAYPGGVEVRTRRADRAPLPAERGTATRGAAAREASERLLHGVARLSPRARLGVAAGVAVALVAALVTAGVLLAGGSPRAKPPTGRASPSADRPLLDDVQTYRDAERGFSVNVPKGWTRSGSSSYVDFTDPRDRGRRIRINVENAGSSDARQFLQVAERGLHNPKVCATPFQEVALRDDVQLAGRPAAELEYRCGQGEQVRHGIWRAVVLDGRSYHFYLTVPDTAFDTSKVIYDEMVRSFALGT
jgi:eukaryotic-like serine/threonine-protein kinase